MLVFDRGQLPGTRGQEEQNVQQQAWLRDATFRDLPEFLRAGDLLVLNDSKVLPARLFAKRAVATGQIEVLLTEEVSEEAGKRERGIGLVWRALVRPGRKVRVGERLEFWGAEQAEAPGLKPLTSEVVDRGLKSAANPGDAPVLTAEVVGAGAFGERTLRFAPVEDFYGVVGRIGHMPLPPYIRHRRDEAEDRERYQTVYAREKGSAAAPTAGLHFTEEVLEALRVKGVEIAYVTLHVGLGTFQPVRVEELKDIRLHAERYTLPAATAEALNRAMGEGRRVVAVGTTTTRVLEHIAAEAEGPVSGLKPENGKGSGRGAEAPSSLGFEAHSGETSMFIGPGHKFKVVRRLLTNFHLPESTLLMLVSAFAGDGEDKLDAGRRKVLEAYAHAVREGYRFYSYGDCMLLL